MQINLEWSCQSEESFTFPMTHSKLFATLIAPVISEAERNEIFEDNVLSLVEINEITCRRAMESNIGSLSTCWLSDYWPLPKSIPWPLISNIAGFSTGNVLPINHTFDNHIPGG